MRRSRSPGDAAGRKRSTKNSGTSLAEGKEALSAVPQPNAAACLSADTLRIAHEMAGIGTFVLNLRTRMASGSPELGTMLGLTGPVEMPLDEYRQRFYHPDERDAIVARSERALERGESTIGEMRVIRADGTEMWVRTMAIRRVSDGGDPIVIGLLQDITEIRRTQRDLETSEARLRTLIEKAPTAIVIIRAGVTAYVNEKCRQLFGAEVLGGAVGLRIEDFWAPEFRARIVQLVLQRAAGMPVPATIDGIAQRADGSQFPVHVELEAVDLPDGPATLAFLTDISEQKRAEARIEVLNRLHAMLSATNEMIVRVNDPHVVLQKACDIAVEKGGFRMSWIGVLDEQTQIVKPVAFAGVVDGYLDSVYIDMRDPKRSAGPSGRAMRSGEHQFCNDIATDPVMAPWREAALARGYHSSAAFPLRADGNVVGLLTLYSPKLGSFDPRELALLDELAVDIGFAIENSRRGKERRSLEEQLRQAQKMEAIGRLAGGIAHDFNNILAAILMQTELVADDETPAQTREMMAEIRESAQRAASLTRQLLVFSRRQVLQPKELDLNQTVADLVKMLGRMVGEDVEVQVRLHPEPLLTRADPGMLDQVLMNLAVNARDAMPGGGRLILRTGDVIIDDSSPPDLRWLVPGRYVSVSVTDNGTGIPEDVVPHIFEPFFTTKAAGKGTGLGLATVFGIVKQHEGAVSVRSKPGEGTTFQVVLPWIAQATSAAASGEQTSRPRGGSETILLVEDDAAIRRLSRRLLERAGYRVLEAGDGAEGERMWDAHAGAVSLLVTDLVMPGGLGGKELAARLQAQDPKLRVIFSTGYSAEVGGHELALLEGQNFIQKPYDSSEFLRTVRRCLDA